MSRTGVYRGRFAELIAAFKANRRPSPGASLQASSVVGESRIRTVFGDDWLVFSDVGGTCPDLLETAIAGRALRSEIMRGFAGDPVPEIISGHTDDGRPSNSPHMAILPLANVGWKWADGRLKGLAVCLPRFAEASDRQRLLEAIASVVRAKGNPEHGEFSVQLPGASEWRLALQMEPSISSLKPFRYLRPAVTWATATPIVLDRHPKEKDGEARQTEIAELIADACTRIGLPRPVTVVPDKHSAIRGTEPAKPSPKSPRWKYWGLPGALRGRVLTHAVLVFEHEVEGPIVLGAGRFMGLGLCLPLDEETQA